MRNQIKKAGVLMVAALLSFTAMAQERTGKERPGKEFRKQIKSYVKENVLPVAVENRRDFESVLSSSEKAQIEDLRERQKVLREKKRAMRGQFRNTKNGAKNSYKFEPTEEQIQAMRAVKKEQRLIATEAFVIVDNHEEFFVAMEEDLRDDRSQWRSDMKAMTERFRNENGMEHRQGIRGKRGHRGRHHRGVGKLDKMFSPVAFVLMDPDRAELVEDPDDINVFPNPATNRQTIAIDMKKSGAVKVELIDSDGKVLEDLFRGTLSEGNNKIEVDLTNLAGKQYFYKITTPSGTETKRVILKN